MTRDGRSKEAGDESMAGDGGLIIVGDESWFGDVDWLKHDDDCLVEVALRSWKAEIVPKFEFNFDSNRLTDNERRLWIKDKVGQKEDEVFGEKEYLGP